MRWLRSHWDRPGGLHAAGGGLRRGWLLAGLTVVLAAGAGGAYFAHSHSATARPAQAREAAAAGPAQRPPARCTAALCVTKTASPATFSRAGEVITFTYTISTNQTRINELDIYGPASTGSGKMPVVMSGGPLGIHLRAAACSLKQVAVDSKSTNVCTVTYTTTPADVARGSVANTDKICGTSGNTPGRVVWVCSPALSAAVTFAEVGAVGIVKTASPGTFTGPGQVITYTYAVTNSGNVPLHDVVVKDSRAGVTVGSCPGTIGSGVTVMCHATYTTTPADTTAGSITDTATVTARTPTNHQVTDTSSEAIVDLEPVAGIEIVKGAEPTTYGAAGTEIRYEYEVINTGNTPLSNVMVSDNRVANDGCPPATIPAFGMLDCEGVYNTTQADVDRGSITDRATVRAMSRTGAVTASDRLTIRAVRRPGLRISKMASVTSFDGAGTEITYTYTVENTGNTTLRGIRITDSRLGAVLGCQTTLLPGRETTCTRTYVTKSADVRHGSIANFATATGRPTTGPPVMDSSNEVVIPLLRAPSISIEKTASVDSFNAAGTPIDYTYLVENTGNVPLTNIGVTDTNPGLTGITCGQRRLAPGQSTTCRAPTYVTTQKDVNNGSIIDVGMVSGKPPRGPKVTDFDELVIDAQHNPEISIVKSASVESFDKDGTEITYTYDVTNDGNVTLDPVTVTDDKAGPVTCELTALAPDEVTTCTATYVTTAADVAAGEVVNLATATGTAPNGSDVTDTDSQTIPFEAKPAISIVKSASVESFDKAGTEITYFYLVTNTGNVTLDSVDVTDSRSLAVMCPETRLVAGADMGCDATYRTTQADVDSGRVENTALATGQPPSGPLVSDETGPVTILVENHPAVSIVKTANTLDITRPGQAVMYFYEVTNTGNVTLDPVAVTDSRLGTISCPLSALPPGQAMICTATHVLTGADIASGSLKNTASVTAKMPSGVTLTADSAVGLPVLPIPAPASPIPPVVAVTG